MGVQRMHHRRPFLDHTDSRMAVAVDPPLMPLGHAEPPLQLQVVLYRREVIPAGEQADAEPAHQVGQALMNRVAVTLQAAEDRIEVALACGGSPRGGVQRRGHLPDGRDLTPDRLLLGLDQVQAPVDAPRQPAQPCLREPPFCRARFRPIDCLTSVSAALISNPGGWSGPPWSLLRMPRTAAQYSSTTLPDGSPGAGAATFSSAEGDPSGTEACRLFSTDRSIPRSPRTFRRICTLAWLSASRTGLARARRKWLA